MCSVLLPSGITHTLGSEISTRWACAGDGVAPHVKGLRCEPISSLTGMPLRSQGELCWAGVWHWSELCGHLCYTCCVFHVVFRRGVTGDVASERHHFHIFLGDVQASFLSHRWGSDACSPEYHCMYCISCTWLSPVCFIVSLFFSLSLSSLSHQRWALSKAVGFLIWGCLLGKFFFFFFFFFSLLAGCMTSLLWRSFSVLSWLLSPLKLWRFQRVGMSQVLFINVCFYSPVRWRPFFFVLVSPRLIQMKFSSEFRFVSVCERILQYVERSRCRRCHPRTFSVNRRLFIRPLGMSDAQSGSGGQNGVLLPLTYCFLLSLGSRSHRRTPCHTYKSSLYLWESSW